MIKLISNFNFISLNVKENSNNVPCPRSWHSMLKINDKNIFIYGGLSQNSYALGNYKMLYSYYEFDKHIKVNLTKETSQKVTQDLL